MFYSVREKDPNLLIRCCSIDPYSSFEKLAIAAAAHFFYQRGGIDATWPLTFDLYPGEDRRTYDEIKIPAATFEVSLEAKPAFSVQRIP